MSLMSNKKKLYSCNNPNCRNPSEAFNGLCTYCEISEYGKLPTKQECITISSVPTEAANPIAKERTRKKKASSPETQAAVEYLTKNGCI